MVVSSRLTHKCIVDVLRRHLGQRTVLYVALPVLRGHIKAARRGKNFAGLSESEIAKCFGQLNAQFGNSDYHSTYVQRRLGERGFLELNGAKYRFRGELLRGSDVASLAALDDELVNSLNAALERRKAVIRDFEKAVRLPANRIQERFALVEAYLKRITGDGGEMFEVMSFAVLREYFRTFGFSLQRFSTTHANDGGMDFVAGEAIYQVTVDKSVQKVRKDLAKAPGTKRVLVRPTVTDEVIALCENEVLETIDLKDLLDHFIAWLLARDVRINDARHLQQVLQIALDEFRRENKAETASA